MRQTPLISVDSIAVAHKGTQIFGDLSLTITDSTRAGVIGRNGAGKSTLLKALAGKVRPYEGAISRRDGVTVSLVPQNVPTNLDLTKTVMESVVDEMNDASHTESEEWEKQLEAADILRQIGFPDSLQEITFLSTLSGGDMRRLLIARALARRPDLILFDEPTDDMDVEQRARFSGLLRRLKTPYVIVSHDRHLLDEATTSTVAMVAQTGITLDMPYSAAREVLKEFDEEKARHAHLLGAEIKKVKEKSTRQHELVGKGAEKRISARDRLDETLRELTLIQIASRDTSPVGTIAIRCDPTRARSLLNIDALEVTVDDRKLFAVSDLTLAPGERAAILGHNGAGKTVLIRSIMNAVNSPDRHTGVRLNPTAKIGYYDQGLEGFREAGGQTTLFDYLQPFVKEQTGLNEKACSVRTHNELFGAGFEHLRHSDPIHSLSGGQQARLRLCALKVSQPNLLILDEPTNSLDAEGIQDLTKTLQAFQGACLFVSHDRDFVADVATVYFVILGGELRKITHIQAYFELLAQGKIEKGKMKQE